MTKFLITGGAGFIGSHIAEKIVKDGLGSVTIYDNLSSGHEKNIAHLGKSVSFIRGDIREKTSLKKALAGVDIVFHHASLVSVPLSIEEPVLTREINIDGTDLLLKCAVEAGVKRVVLASSAAVYGPNAELPNKEDMRTDPISPYASSKLENEKSAEHFSEDGKLETVCLRYFNVYGPRQDPSSEYSGVISKFFERAEQGKAMTIYGDGLQTRDLIFASDVATANILAAFGKGCGHGEAVNVATGKATSLLDLVVILEKIFGKKMEVKFGEARKGDIKYSVADATLAEELFGFKAKMDLEHGMRLMMEKR